MQETQPTWFAVYIKPRQERIALEHPARSTRGVASLVRFGNLQLSSNIS
jgi:hypothetical protein